MMTEESSPYSIQIADFVRDNVVAADPNKGRCLVTNGSNPIQLCHCISRMGINDDHMVRHRSPQYLFWV